MKWYTHSIFAASVCSFITANPAHLILSFMFGILPDMDYVIKHRSGPTHSIFTAAVISLVMLCGTNTPLIAVVAFASILSHLLMDAMTKSGVPFFWPLTGKSVAIPPYVSYDNLLVNFIFSTIALFVFLHNVILGFR